MARRIAKIGAYFAGGLTVSLLALAFVAWALLRGIREFLERSPWRIPSSGAQGFSNLYRPGNQAQAIHRRARTGRDFHVGRCTWCRNRCRSDH
jgi:hypothetical protein